MRSLVRSLLNGHDSGPRGLQELDVRRGDVHGLVGLRHSDTLRQNTCGVENNVVNNLRIKVSRDQQTPRGKVRLKPWLGNSPMTGLRFGLGPRFGLALSEGEERPSATATQHSSSSKVFLPGAMARALLFSSLSLLWRKHNPAYARRVIAPSTRGY